MAVDVRLNQHNLHMQEQAVTLMAMMPMWTSGRGQQQVSCRVHILHVMFWLTIMCVMCMCTHAGTPQLLPRCALCASQAASCRWQWWGRGWAATARPCKATTGAFSRWASEQSFPDHLGISPMHTGMPHESAVLVHVSVRLHKVASLCHMRQHAAILRRVQPTCTL